MAIIKHTFTMTLISSTNWKCQLSTSIFETTSPTKNKNNSSAQTPNSWQLLEDVLVLFFPLLRYHDHFFRNKSFNYVLIQTLTKITLYVRMNLMNVRNKATSSDIQGHYVSRWFNSKYLLSFARHSFSSNKELAICIDSYYLFVLLFAFQELYL